MKQRVRVQKSDAAAETPTNRLTAIKVDEVSIVDRAANQRKYLVVKNAGAAPAANVQSQPSAAATLKLAADVKKKASEAVKAAQGALTELAKAVDAAVETDGAAMPDELLNSCVSIVSDLAAGCSMSVESVEEPKLEKAGRKISAKRLQLLTAAKANIDAIIAEAATSDDSAEEDEKVTATSKSETAAVSGETKSVPTTTPANPEIESLKVTVDKLVGTVSKMAELFEGQNKRFAELAKARGTSQQVETDEQPVKKQESVVWPMDMARPPRVQQ